MSTASNFQSLPTVDELNTLAKSDFEQWLKLIVTGGALIPFGSSSSYARTLYGHILKKNVT